MTGEEYAGATFAAAQTALLHAVTDLGHDLRAMKDAVQAGRPIDTQAVTRGLVELLAGEARYAGALQVQSILANGHVDPVPLIPGFVVPDRPVDPLRCLICQSEHSEYACPEAGAGRAPADLPDPTPRGT